MASPPSTTIELGLQAPARVRDVGTLAAEAERLGYARFMLPDHPGSAPDPWVLLGRAAAATTTIGLGTYVLNTGVREPWQVAAAAATLHALCPGRVWLGLGAGHTPAEWQLAGRAQPGAAARVSRLEEFTQVTLALLGGGPVRFHGEHFRLEDAQLGELSPGQARIPLIVGGNGPRVLRLGGRAARIVSLTGFGRTLADGHTHLVRWSRQAVEQSIAAIDEGVGADARRPTVEALVQHLELTEDRVEAARRFLADGGLELDHETALNTPFLFFGRPEQIAGQMRAWQQRLGIGSYVVRPPAMHAAAQVAQAL